MSKFCPTCENLLVRETSSGELKFYCVSCSHPYDAAPEDTLIFSQRVLDDNSIHKYETFIRVAAFDNVNQKVKKTCPGCGADKVRKIRIGSLMRNQYVCTCGKYFF